MAWRLGFGWILGRHLLLISTQNPEGGVRRSVAPYVFAGGDFYVAGSADGWARDIESKPHLTVQAWPGPRNVESATVTDPDELRQARRMLGPESASTPIIRLRGTGQPTPMMLEPDLLWVWTLVIPALLWKALRR